MANEDDALAVAQEIVETYKNPLNRMVLKAKALPQLMLGDMVTVFNKDTQITELTRIFAYKMQMSSSGFNQEFSVRSVTGLETFTYFTINVSAIEGSDVISP